MLDFGALPPEINSGRIYAGPGSGPMMAVAAVWDALAGQLESMSRGYAAVIAGLQGEGWSGGASQAMADAASPYVTWLTTTGAQAEQTATRARAAAAAYETAFAASVPPALVTANRTQLANLVATNVLGQNTTAIAATEAGYAEMWAQDAAAMYGYAASSSTATTLTPFSEPPQTTNAAGQPAQSAAVAQAVGGSAASHTQTSLSQLLAAVPQHLQSLSTTGSSASSTAATSTSPFVTAAYDFNQLTGSVFYPSRTATSAMSGFSGLYRSGVQGGASGTPVVPKVPSPLDFGGKALSSAGAGRTVLASVGRAAPIGGLSVPQTWASATPVASAVELPHWMSEVDLGAAAPAAQAAAGNSMGAAPVAGLGPMAGMLARPSVSNVLRVEPRRFKMPRPSLGG